MTHDEMIAVIQAHKEGKSIQSSFKFDGEWSDCIKNVPEWDFYSMNYRVKPETKYRPYESAEECFEDVKKHGGWVIRHGIQYRQITDIGYGWNRNIVKINGSDWMQFEELMQSVWADDGTPCGVKVEE